MIPDLLLEAWPLLGLGLRHGDLELRYPGDELVVAIGRVVHDDLLLPAERHFMPTLMRAVAGDEAGTLRNVLAYHWGVRRDTGPDDWRLPLAVLLDGEVVGVQEARAADFRVIRDVHTGSFLAPSARGRGVGTRMRAMVLELAFAHLGADTASSGYVRGNLASAGVSATFGYLPDGVVLEAVEGVRHEVQRLRLGRERWAAFRPDWLDGVQVTGLGPVRRFLALDG